MPGLRGTAGGHDADIGAFDRREYSLVPDMRESKHIDGGRGMGDVQRLALGHALGDVEEDDVTELLEAGKVGERASDHARSQ